MQVNNGPSDLFYQCGPKLRYIWPMSSPVIFCCVGYPLLLKQRHKKESFSKFNNLNTQATFGMLYAYTYHSAKATVQSHREQEVESLKGYSKITLQYTYIKRCTAIISREVSNRQVKRQNNIDLTQGHITASWRASGEAVCLPQDQ